MNFEQLVAEFQERGFQYISTARSERYVNDAYSLDICEEEDWPFLEATSEGKAPLTITDLRTIEYIINVTQGTKPYPLKRGRITDDHDTSLATPGTGYIYYLTGGNTVNVYPADTVDTFLVRYWKVPTELSGSAEPLLPKRFHSLIVDGAVARAYEEADDYELANVAKTRFDTRLQAMRDSLMNQQHDSSDDYVVLEDPTSLYY